jgi:hypothetical protein
MAEQLIEKAKYVWKIKNLTKENLESYSNDGSVESDQFEILIGENKTKW